MARVIEVISPSGAVVQRLPLADGRTRLAAQPGYRYRIADDANVAVSEQVTVKRVDNDLLLEGFQGERVVQVDGFFSRCTPDRSCAFSLEGLSGGAAPADITPTSDAVAALRDGSFVLFTPGAVEAAAGTAAPVETPSVTPPPVVDGGSSPGIGKGWLALAGGAVLLAAAGGGGGGGGGTAVSAGGATPTPAPAPTPEPTPAPAPTPAPGPAPAPGTPDTTAPNAPVIASIGGGAIVNADEAAAGVVVAGTAEAGSTVRGTWNGGASQSTTADASGNWRLTFTGAAIADGQGPLSITATDAAGNTSTAATRAVSADRTLPQAPSITVISGAGGDGIVNASEAGAGITVNGQAPGESGGTVRASWNGGPEQTALVDSAGAWRLTFTGAAINEGQGSLSVTTTDAAGNIGAAATRAVNADKTPPTVAITAVIDLTGTVESGEETFDTTPTLTGTVSEPGLSVTILRDGTTIGSTRAIGTSWRFTDPGATAGDHVYVARATDPAGNRGESGPFELEIDPIIERGVATDPATATAGKEPAEGVVYSMLDVGFSLDAIVPGRLDMTGGGADTMVIDASDVLSTSASLAGVEQVPVRIALTGDTDDTVAASGFRATGNEVEVDGVGYAVFVDSATAGQQVELLVQNTVRIL